MKVLLVLGSMCVAGAAQAHGTIPTSNAILFTDESRVFLGTNFGGVLFGDDPSEQDFVCERAVTGEQTSIDGWVWAGGRVAGIVTTGGFIRGVYLADAGACGFEVVAGTADLYMSDLTVDTLDPNDLWAVGTTSVDGDEARLVHAAVTTTGEVTAEVVASQPSAYSTRVRAAGGHAYTIFQTEAVSEIVHVGGPAIERFAVDRSDGKTMRVLGVDPAAPETVWLVQSDDVGDTVLRSEDAGETRVPVLTAAARFGGFAVDGSKVWLQSPQLGVHFSDDGGKTFAPLRDSPHGACLAIGPDGKLYACGVPWQDDMALGVSDDDGAAFTAVIPFYDGIVRALDCGDGSTAMCGEELDFLREYYGFGPAIGEPDPELVEVVEVVEDVVEPQPEGAEAAEVVTAEPTPKPKDDGCAGGGAGLAWWWLVSAAGSARAWRARRPRSRSCRADRAARAG